MSNASRLPRVLMLSDVYFPRVNGVSTSIQTFRNALEALGCETLLVAPEYPGERDDEPGITRVPARQVPFDPEDRLMSRRHLERACASVEGRFDLVHIQTPFRAHAAGVRLARRLGVPVVESYHTYFEHYFHHYMPYVPRVWLAFAARALSRHQCNAVDAVIAPSRQMADALAAYGIRTEIRVIPTGLDLERFRGGDGARFRARFGIAPDRPLMLTVSRVAFEKNIVFLIDVLDRVGSLAVNQPGAPEWRWDSSIGYDNGPFGFVTSVRYVGGGKYNANYTIEDLSAADNKVDAEVYVNMSARYGLEWRETAVDLFLGVNNVLDNEAPPLADGFISQRPVNAVLYDVVGRYVYGGVRLNFK